MCYYTIIICRVYDVVRVRFKRLFLNCFFRSRRRQTIIIGYGGIRVLEWPTIFFYYYYFNFPSGPGCERRGRISKLNRALTRERCRPGMYRMAFFRAFFLLLSHPTHSPPPAINRCVSPVRFYHTSFVIVPVHNTRVRRKVRYRVYVCFFKCRLAQNFSIERFATKLTCLKQIVCRTIRSRFDP